VDRIIKSAPFPIKFAVLSIFWICFNNSAICQVKKYISTVATKYDWDQGGERYYYEGEKIQDKVFEFTFDFNQQTILHTVQSSEKDSSYGLGKSSYVITDHVLLDSKIHKIFAKNTENGDIRLYILTDKTLRILDHYYTIIYQIVPSQN
jgi:hypothetical protein